MEYAGAICHLMNRGDRREAIVHDDFDRKRFVTTLGEVCLKTGWQVQAYGVLPNHFHLVVEPPEATLVAGIRRFLSTDTARFNRRHKRFGHRFSGRSKSLIVDGSGSGYLRTGCDSVHLNPVRSKLLHPQEPVREYAWSSWPGYLQLPEQRPLWLRVERLLGEHGGAYQGIRRDWCLGSEKFREELLAQANTRAGDDRVAKLKLKPDEQNEFKLECQD